ncbi:hypothetical protein CXB51_031019 [Gossypium anomalum]|uniref:DUF4283 domain-containing protein n=1 Tax=Gossypium anomalum TaxID=47600 RepID=A0A8J5Y4S1_9ROSI|nr:hypothetical protein CXB51_031019 [Gossypium anomalum]
MADLMEGGIADLNLDNGEEVAFSLQDESEAQNAMYNFCLVGCFLTAIVVHFPAMRNTMANIWHPLEGVQIFNLGEKRFLFKIVENEDPLSVPLVYSDWWIQISYDTKHLSNGYLNYMRIRMQIDVRLPLKRRKKIKISEGNFCRRRLQYGMQEVEIGWGLSLRAQGRRASIANSIWLRGEEDNSFFGNPILGNILASSKFPTGVNHCQNGNNFKNNGVKDLDSGKGQISGPSVASDVQKKVPSGMGRPNGLEAMNMDCELEDEPFINEEGKKRQRFNALISNVSLGQDSLEVTEEFSSQAKHILVAAIGRAGRMQ